MSFEKLNSVGGFSTGIPAVDVVAANGIVIADINANVVQANTFQYSNGQPISGSAAGSDTQVQYNAGNSQFGASPDFTFDSSNSILTITNVSATGIVNLGSVSNVVISGGDNGYFLQTDGTGNLAWAAGGGGGGNGNPGGSNTQVQFNDSGTFGGVTGFTFNKSTGILTVPILTANTVNGNVAYAVTANTVIDNQQPNITSLGTLTSLAVSGNANVGNIGATFGVFTNVSGNGSALSSITGANVIGTVPTATNVVASAQPNITSVGTLTSLSISGNANIGNIGTAGLITAIGNIQGSNLRTGGLITATGNITGGNITTSGTANVGNLVVSGVANISSIGNLRIPGGTLGYVMSTDGAGNLSWVAQGGNAGGGASIANGNSSLNIATAGGNIVANVGGFNDILKITPDGANLTNLNVAGDITSLTLTVTGNSDLGNVGNITINGGGSGYILSTDGLGGLSWISGSNGAYIANGNARVETFSANSNVVIAGNLIPNANITYSLGSDTNRFTNLYLSGNTIILGDSTISSNATSTIITNPTGSNFVISGAGGSYFISNGTSNATVQNNGNINFTVAGTTNTVIFAETSSNFAGNVSVTGNVIGGNISTVGLITATGNITGGNLHTSGLISATGNVLAGNIGTSGALTVTGNVDFTLSPNVSLGSVANLHIGGGTNGYVLGTDGTGNLSWVVKGTSSNATPGGANTQVQFNDAGTFGGVANLVYNKDTDVLSVTGEIIANTFQMGSGAYNFFNQSVYFATTASTSPNQVLWGINATNVSGVDFTIVAIDATGNTLQSSKISSIVLGTSVIFNEYAGLGINGGVGTFSVDYGAGQLQLSVTPDSSDLTEYNILITEYLKYP